VTADGGEIVALDAAGYGQLTIAHALTIVGEHIAFATAPASASGITISAGASDTVLLRNIEINGAGAANSTGITLNSGHLILDHSVLTQLTTGLAVNGTKADVTDTDILANGTGISTTGTGVDIQSGNFGAGNPGPTEVRIVGGKVVGNTTAFFMNNPGTSTANPPFNDATIFLYQPSGGLTTYLAGNTTMTSGTGPSCTNQAGNCTAPETFNSGTGNFNQR
jgi:hypothetical protein